MRDGRPALWAPVIGWPIGFAVLMRQLLAQRRKHLKGLADKSKGLPSKAVARDLRRKTIMAPSRPGRSLRLVLCRLRLSRGALGISCEDWRALNTASCGRGRV
eukprot:2224816-Prymnesium_polylepis.2